MPLAATAALLADPTRAAFCEALLDGRAWTAGELARHARVAAATASEHLTRLVAGGLLTEERQGRHRYVRLAGPEVAALIEDLASFAPEATGYATHPTGEAPETTRRAPRSTGEALEATGRPPRSTGDAPRSAGDAPDSTGGASGRAADRRPRMGRRAGTPGDAPVGLREVSRAAALARARTCYDHLAGRLGVSVSDAMFARGLVSDVSGLALTDAGRGWLSEVDIRLPIHGTRPVVRGCLDWTERRPHLAGALGAALCTAALDRGWVTRIGSGRALRVTDRGTRAFAELLGVPG